MKTNKCLFILFATSLLTIAGCGGGNGGPTTLTKYQKVSKAFEAVGRTLDLKSNRSSRLHMPYRAIDIHGDMTGFESYFANAQTDEKIEDQIDLNTPPFMQFQYLKIIYETIGANYSFGTKYSYPITGDVYIDFETGYQDRERSEENKYSFTFDFSIFIEIDENDLITSEVGMDITLVKGQNSYKNYKYAYLVLDYDFEKNDDNYELALYDFGQEKDMPYLDCDYGYEYDYCLVSSNKLTEWRKFRYEADRKMVKDASHDSLDSYLREGAVITGDNQRWYKNNVIKRVDSKTDDSLLIAKELYRSFGLNDTDIDTERYFAKESTNSTVIKTIYDRASSEYGDELIYHIIAKKEDDDPVDKGWPSEQIRQIAEGLASITFSNRDAVTYSFNRDDVDGQSASLVITVTGANAGEYAQFENELRETYGLNRGEDQQGFHIYSVALIDNTILSVYVSPSTNTIIFQHYFGGGGGGQGQYDPIELENMFNYDLPYNFYSTSFYGYEKEVLGDLVTLFNDENVNRIFTKKVDLQASKRIEITLSEKDIENVGGSKTLKEARDNVMNMYGNYYAKQWKTTKIQNGFTNNDNKDLVVVRPGEGDGELVVYFFRFVDDTLSKYFDGTVSVIIEISIYAHPRNDDVYLERTIGVNEGESVFSSLESGVDYYLDADMTVLLTSENCYAYQGMELHKKAYVDLVFDKISVPGGIDYELPNNWGNSSQMEDDEEIYQRVMNMVNDPNIRSYLEGHISSSNPTNMGYQIFIGPDVAEYLEKDNFVEAARELSNQYKGLYKEWKVGKKASYFYIGDKEEDVVFFNDKALEEGMIEFIHVRLTSPVMANYESGSQGGGGEGGGGGETPATTQVTLVFYSNGTYNYTDYITCPTGDNVRLYLNGIEDYFYLDSSFSKSLPDEYPVTEGLTIYINVVSSDVEWVKVILIVDGDSESPQIHQIDAILGDDLYGYLVGYADEFYLEAAYQNKITEGYCSVSYDMTVYGKTNQSANTCIVNVYVVEDGQEPALLRQIKFTLYEDVRTEVYGLDINGTMYADESLSELLDETNCYAHEGMCVYIVKDNIEPPSEEIYVTVYKFNKDHEKMGMDVITCKDGEDVRNYLRKYNADFFLDSDFSTPLDAKNCYAFDGMEIYAVLRG